VLHLRRERSSVEAFVEALRREAGPGQLAALQQFAAEPPRFAQLREELMPVLHHALAEAGANRFYSHQAEAIDAIRTARDTMIVTPTASGKTIAFNVPVIERLLCEPAARALYLYPTNALVNDQSRALSQLLDRLNPSIATGVLTGATDNETRRRYRAQPPQILLTNPEMLHMSILGQHRLWANFLRGLRFVVLDELHLYRGLFGVHLAMVLRRLLRVAAMHGVRPQLVACSATVGNPGELAERITGRPFTVVTQSGAARGPRTFVVWRPPLSSGVKSRAGDDRRAPERGDPQTEAVNLFCRLIDKGLGTILFALTRRGAETMLMQARERLGPSLATRIAPYRNGYTPEHRRAVEQRLKSGDLLGVISTNALEVGIDIGGLDAAVIAGFPGSRTSLWQQAGRSGRGSRGSLVVLVPFNRVVDGYYAAHPRDLIDGRFEDSIVDLANPQIVALHLACAARERILGTNEAQSFSPVAAAAVDRAERAGTLRASPDGWVATGTNEHRAVSLRGGSSRTYRIVSPGGEIGTIDEGHLHREMFPGAIYLHDGERFRVTGVDTVREIVRLEPEPSLLMTEPVMQTTVHVEAVQSSRSLQFAKHIVALGTGTLRVRQITTAYREAHVRSRERARSVVLPTPLVHEMQTYGCWMILPNALRAELESAERGRFVAGLHALEHMMPPAVSLRILCDARDVVTTYEVEHAGMGGPTLFLFDAYAGGAGIAARAFLDWEALLHLCHAIVRDCPCTDGCPSCVIAATCWRQYDDVDKRAALALMRQLGPTR